MSSNNHTKSGAGLLVVPTILAVIGVIVWHLECTPAIPERFPNDAALRDALIGKSEDEVRQLLGEPNALGGAKLIGDNEVWQYDHVRQEPGIDHKVPLYIHIGKDGKVSKLTKFDGSELGR